MGKQKPESIIFETTYENLGLTSAEKSRIIMVGQNLMTDTAGVNRQSMTTVWLDWSPRYFHTAERIPLVHMLEERPEKL